MSADFHIKQNDLQPHLEATLEDDSGSAIDLSSASSVDFHMKQLGSDSTKVDASATITDAANGTVEYDWTSGDTDTVGTFLGEFEVDWGSDKETFPNHDYIEVKIIEEIA